MFAGYEMFRNLALGKRLRKKKKEIFHKCLLDPGEGWRDGGREGERKGGREGGRVRAERSITC